MDCRSSSYLPRQDQELQSNRGHKLERDSEYPCSSSIAFVSEDEESEDKDKNTIQGKIETRRQFDNIGIDCNARDHQEEFEKTPKCHNAGLHPLDLRCKLDSLPYPRCQQSSVFSLLGPRRHPSMHISPKREQLSIDSLCDVPGSISIESLQHSVSSFRAGFIFFVAPKQALNAAIAAENELRSAR